MSSFIGYLALPFLILFLLFPGVLFLYAVERRLGMPFFSLAKKGFFLGNIASEAVFTKIGEHVLEKAMSFNDKLDVEYWTSSVTEEGESFDAKHPWLLNTFQGFQMGFGFLDYFVGAIMLVGIMWLISSSFESADTLIGFIKLPVRIGCFFIALNIFFPAYRLGMLMMYAFQRSLPNQVFIATGPLAVMTLIFSAIEPFWIRVTGLLLGIYVLPFALIRWYFAFTKFIFTVHDSTIEWAKSGT